MLMTIVKVVTALGGLIIAGLSAFAAFKRSSNCGSHTLVTANGMTAPSGSFGSTNRCAYGYNQPYYGGYHAQTSTTTTTTSTSGQYTPPRFGYDCGYGYGYGYGNQPYYGGYNNTTRYGYPRTPKVAVTGNTENDINTVANAVNNISEQVDDMKDTVAEVAAHVANVEQTQGVPAAQQITQPVFNQPEPTIDATATIPASPLIDVSYQNRLWEATGDEVMRRKANEMNAQMGIPTMNGTHNFTSNIPTSTLGQAAVNSAYNFNMNQGFNQYYDSDIHRQLEQYRHDTANSAYNTPQYMQTPTMITAPVDGFPTTMFGGINYNIDGPNAPRNIFKDPNEPIDFGAPIDYSYMRTSEPYGSIGEIPFPSTNRQRFPYGNI